MFFQARRKRISRCPRTHQPKRNVPRSPQRPRKRTNATLLNPQQRLRRLRRRLPPSPPKSLQPRPRPAPPKSRNGTLQPHPRTTRPKTVNLLLPAGIASITYRALPTPLRSQKDEIDKRSKHARLHPPLRLRLPIPPNRPATPR